MIPPEPGDGAADTAREPDEAAAAAFAASTPALKPGVRWREFQIAEPAGAPQSFFADNAATMERVVIRVSPVTDATEWRRGAWTRLAALRELALVPVLDAIEEDGWRYEITAVPPPTTLRESMAAQKIGARDVEALVRQLAPILIALHREGVVHLNLRPDVVYVDETPQGMVFTLGGLHAATLYTQPKLAPADVDPLYAPPEAAGLAFHQPGTRLCAWDWWSLGRVLQEAILGRPVLSLVLARDVSRMTPELRERAEQLLLERAPPGIRAGAIEEMPDMDGATTTLLRGLLSGSLEARWRGDAVERWLRREPVKEYYDLPRTARLWSWRGRAMTVPEAADLFTQAEQWEDGEGNLFNADDPESLAFFLHDSPAHRPEEQRLQAALDMAELPAWEQVPLVARRPAIAAAAWLALAATGGPAQLRVRGCSVDPAGLLQLLGSPGLMDAGALVQALLAPPFIQFVEPYDPAAARVLTTLSAVAGGAGKLAAQNGWADPHDGDVQTRLLALALQPVATLRRHVEQLRTRYATHRDAALARLLSQPNHSSAELVVLAFTGEAANHGYVTHADWAREKLDELHAIGEQTTRVRFWLGLRRVLRLGRPIGERWPVFAAAAAVIAIAAGLLLRSSVAAAGIAAALLAARLWLSWWVRQMVRKCDPAAGAWTWHDGLHRCEHELGRFPADRAVPLAELGLRAHQVRRDMAKLATPGHPVARLVEPWWWELWAGFGITLALAVLAAVPAFRSRLEPVEPAAMAPETSPAGQPGTPKGPVRPAVEPRLDPAALVASGEYELVDDGFGRGLRGPLRKWDYRSPPSPPPLEIRARAPASAEQSAFALVSATLALRPYARRAVGVMLAVRVPTTHGFGVMIFNTRDRKLASREVLLLRQPPREGEWYRFGALHVLHLGVPASLRQEISLAPP